MSKDLLGLGDNDINEIDRQRRDERRQRNPDNEPEVTLEMWTLAHLTRDDQVVRSVVYGVVAQCLTDDYLPGDIVCSPTLLQSPPHPGRRIYVTKLLRYECKGVGREITIPEGDLDTHIPDPDVRPSPVAYLTGITALNLIWPDRPIADWHTHGLVHRETWTWSGVQVASTQHLLGYEGVHDATGILRRYVPDTPDGTLAASYERAVFDLVYHSAVTGKPVPNIQWKDLDDAVDATQVQRWIDAVDLTESQKATMLAWFNNAE